LKNLSRILRIWSDCESLCESFEFPVILVTSTAPKIPKKAPPRRRWRALVPQPSNPQKPFEPGITPETLNPDSYLNPEPYTVWRLLIRYVAQPSTLNPQPSALNPQPSTPNPQPSTLNPQPSTLNPQPSTLNPRLSTLNPQPSTLNPQLSNLNPRLSTLNPQPSTLNPLPSALSPQPSTLNPEP
jgi:hypothetical protein